MDAIPDELKCVIETNDGPICGYSLEKDGATYHRFLGIPYAKPPLEKRRFLPPQPISPWKDLRDCTQPANASLYCDSVKHGEVAGSEDCLYIDVTSPDIQPEKLKPVMFWIGCYGFVCTKDHYLEPSVIVQEDVIFVRCGFRLGPFGFLSTNDISAPGNTGLKDIVLALKWVQRNISAFGGDKDNVTIFGSSSGGAIVHFMILSPMATGLFHKAIIQSASALNTWSIDKNPEQSVMELAKLMGIQANCSVEIVEKLKTLPAQEIMQAYYEMNQKLLNGNDTDVFNPVFKPCIEMDFEGQPAFITKSPHLIIKSGNFNKVPLIIGSNNIEGSLLQFIKKDFYDDFAKFNENVQLLVPRTLAGEEKLSIKIGHQLIKFYVGENETMSPETKNEYLQLVSDYYFLYYVNKTIRLYSQVAPGCPIYYYILNFAGHWHVPEMLRFFNSVGHCAEIPFIFGLRDMAEPFSSYKGSRDSIKTRKRVIRMWTNFAKYGNPTPVEDDPLLQITWDPVENKDKLNYLSIGTELTKGRNPFLDRMTFWDDLHQEHTFLRVLTHFSDIGVSW